MDALKALDHSLFFAVHSLQKFHLDWLLAWPTYLGSQWYAVPLLILGTILISRERFLSRSLAAAFPVVISHLGIDAMKSFFARPRPFTAFASDPGAVTVIFDPPHTASFPSGHASNAFAAAVLLSTWFGVPRSAAYGAALLISLTRLYIGVHFPTDILAGALWGFAVTTLWIRLVEKRGFQWKPAPR